MTVSFRSALVLQPLSLTCISVIKKQELGSWRVILFTADVNPGLSFQGDLDFMTVLGNQHAILFCQVTVFETDCLEASTIAISVEDDAKCNGDTDLCGVQTTHALEILCMNTIKLSLIQILH